MSTSRAPAIWQDELERTLERELPGFLPAQRWFASKARRISGTTVEECVWLVPGDEPGALVVARVEFATGDAERYTMLVALRREPQGTAALGSVVVGTETRHVCEAAALPRYACELLRHLGHAHQVPGGHGGALLFADLPASLEGALQADRLEESQVRPLGAEQSNTSLRVGTGHVFKIFRRVESGENPEVEVGRFLATRTSFRAAPALRGSVTWRSPGGEARTLGALQDLVENQGDGWQWTLARLREVQAGALAAGVLTDAMAGLGRVTAELHAAFACDAAGEDFAPQPATAADVLAWEAAFHAGADHALGLLAEQFDGLRSPLREECARVLDSRAAVHGAARLPEAVGADGFQKVRIHGDYHLGQTLRTADGFMIIDFEGEPARPLAERRRLHCALKDVAGMLRSFDYALETARAGDAGTPGAPGPPLREAFLAAYESHALELHATFLPADAATRARWLTFFELDKTLYELEYELQNRPDWLHIPVRGILRMLDGIRS